MNNANDAIGDAWAVALGDVGRQTLALARALADCKRLGQALAREGVTVRGYPDALEKALQMALTSWQAMPAGRLALGLPPLATPGEQARAAAMVDLATRGQQLAAMRAAPVDAAYAGDKRKRIEDAATAVALARRRVAELDGDTLGYKTWLREFLISIRQALDAAVVIEKPGISRLIEADRQADAAAAARADPLGALARAAGL